jgi:hypothetical protein
MNRGARRTPIFNRDDDAHPFLDTVGGGVERFGIEVHAYSLMPILAAGDRAQRVGSE